MSETYIGTKLIKAEAMNRAQYNAFRGWELPADENGAEYACKDATAKAREKLWELEAYKLAKSI